MPIEVTARHLTISQELQAYARGKADALVSEFPKAEHVRVVLDTIRQQYSAEFIVQHKGLSNVEAAETTDNMMASIDLAAEKVAKQMRKHHEKIVDKRHHG